MNDSEFQHDLIKRIGQLEQLIRSFDHRLNLLEKQLVEKKPPTRGINSTVARPLLDNED